MTDSLSIFGSAASIVSLIVAAVAIIRSQSAKNAAEDARREMRLHTATVNHGKIHSSLISMRDIVFRHTSRGASYSAAGTDVKEDGDRLRSNWIIVKDKGAESLFSKDNLCSNVMQRWEGHVAAFQNSRRNDERLHLAQELVNDIDVLIREVERALSRDSS